MARERRGDTMSDLARSLQRAGFLFVIAHPRREGHPFCTGCRWAFSDMFPGPARHVEIWNREWTKRTHNEEAVHLFYRWLNSGYRMVATAGTDIHRKIPGSKRTAVNRVYAQDNTETEILAALARGHCYVSSGPELKFAAETADCVSAGMGDLVPQGPLRILGSWRAGGNGSNLSGLDACLIRQGQEVGRWPCSQENEANFETKANAGSWFALELRDRSGELHALSNPIFVGREYEPWR